MHIVFIVNIKVCYRFQFDQSLQPDLNISSNDLKIIRLAGN
jgi:hypothetical protein